MKVYFVINRQTEELLDLLEEMKPDLIRSRQVIEVSTEDKSIAAILTKFCADLEDEVNAVVPVPEKIVKRGRKSNSNSNGKREIPELAGMEA